MRNEKNKLVTYFSKKRNEKLVKKINILTLNEKYRVNHHQTSYSLSHAMK